MPASVSVVRSILWFALAAPAVLAHTQSAKGAEETRPNIIFLLTDDQRDNTLAAMGHPFVQTPHLDQLLRQSVRFANTYVAEPTCSPSRTALLTGMCERLNGIGFTSSYQLTEQQWQSTYPALLREAGYYTGFIGKFGIEYYTFLGHADSKFDFWRGHDGWTRFFPKDSDSPSCTPYDDARHDLITMIMGERITEFLESLPDERPFCLSVSFNVPHGSQTTSMYPDYPDWHRMTRPANENPKLKGSPFYDNLYRDVAIHIPDATGTDPYRFIPQFIMDQDQGRRSDTYPYDYTPSTCREHHIRYYQTITGLDHAVGQLREQLRQRHLDDNTIIIFASDHGLLMGEYGMGGKALLYDLTAKIPCFVFDPCLPHQRRGVRVDLLVSSLDIPATILDMAGLPPSHFMSGRSLVPLLAGREVEWREELFLENLYTGRDTPFQEGVRLGQWKYIRMYDGKLAYLEEDLDFTDRPPDFEMLFDLEADPAELTNLVADPAHREMLAVLRTKCAKHSQSLNQRRQRLLKSVHTEKR